MFASSVEYQRNDPRGNVEATLLTLRTNQKNLTHAVALRPAVGPDAKECGDLLSKVRGNFRPLEPTASIRRMTSLKSPSLMPRDLPASITEYTWT